MMLKRGKPGSRMPVRWFQDKDAQVTLTCLVESAEPFQCLCPIEMRSGVARFHAGRPLKMRCSRDKVLG